MLEESRGPATGGVLLVGSVPLRSAEEVFQVMAAELGDRVTQLPDGETGPRSDWIVWQYPVLSSRPEFEVCPPGDQPHRALPRLRVRDGESLDTLRFDDLGYAEAAISSYGIFERLVRLGRSIPPGVQLGYHFCHGHEAHHRDRPYHAQPLVDVANALSLSLSRSLDWIHLPVAGDRVDLRFFETLAQLALRPETRLYLGLLHPSDGELGARARIVAAQRFVRDFGVATDCGWARHRPQDVASLIELHRAVTAPIQPATRRRPAFSWPAGWERVPADDWTRQPVDAFGEAYDNVDHHSWYRNLDATVEELSHLLNDGDILVDYSGGTGILLDRLKLRMFDARAGAVIVDSSPKFLRVALEKFRDDPDVGLRLLRYLKPEKRLQRLDEVLGPQLLERRVDAIVSTNAIHLYPDLADTVASWLRALRPGGHVLINSGNIRNPRARRNEWILDETVRVVGDLAEGLVRNDPCYATYRGDLDDEERMAAHHAYRDRVFLHPRPLDLYLETLELAGLKVESVREASIEVRVDDWYELLRTYHDAVLGWVGGTEKIDGVPPSPEAVADRLGLIRHAMDVLFHGRAKFQACWTYITCVH